MQPQSHYLRYSLALSWNCCSLISNGDDRLTLITDRRNTLGHVPFLDCYNSIYLLSFQCSVAMRSESFGSTRLQKLLFTQWQWSKVNPEINLTMKGREDASGLPLLPYVQISEISQSSYNLQNKAVVRALTNCINISHCNDIRRKVAGSIPDGAIRILHWQSFGTYSTRPLAEMSTSDVAWE